MKKVNWVFSICLLISILFLYSPTAMSKQVVLRWANMSPNKGVEKPFFDWFIPELEKRTNGRVKVQMFWASSLCKITEMPETLKSGLADVAWIQADYHTGYATLVKVLGASSLFSPNLSPVVMTERWLQLWDQIPAFYEEFDRIGFVPFTQRYYDVFWLFSNKSVRNIEDLKGVKIRTSGEIHQIAYRELDAIPMFLPSGEIYGAMQKGIVDGVAASPGTANRYKTYEVAKYVVKQDLMGTWAQWTMNMKTFKSLSWIDQKTLFQLGREGSMLIAKENEKERKRVVKIFEKAGLELIDLSEKDKKAWEKKPGLTRYREKWIKETEEKGLPAQNVLKSYKKIMGIE